MDAIESSPEIMKDFRVKTYMITEELKKQTKEIVPLLKDGLKD